MADAGELQSYDVPIERRQWSRGTWLVLTALLGATLLLPALFNRFPLLFPDTPAYLSVAYGKYWNLDRSGFYGLAFKPILMWANPVLGLWIVIALQSLIIAVILLMVVRRTITSASPAAALAVTLPIALFTSLPWHAGQLMPDAMTGILILMVWLAASRDLNRPGTAILWLCAGLLALVHYTHIGLFAVAAAATIFAAATSGIARREIIARFMVATLVLTAVASSHVAANVGTFGRWAIAPMSPMFLFARLNEDGLAPRWLDRHCGYDAPADLCNLRSELPRDSQVLLWGGAKSPLTARIHERIGQAESWRWIEMLDKAASGSIREEPLAFLASSAKAGTRQFVHFEALDNECPSICRASIIDLVHFRPAMASRARNSREFRDQIARRPIKAVTSAVAIVGQFMLVLFFATAIRRRDGEAISLIGVVIVGLVVNALLAGALSDVHDRYQSRVIWLAPYVVLLLAVRWHAFGAKTRYLVSSDNGGFVRRT